MAPTLASCKLINQVIKSESILKKCLFFPPTKEPERKQPAHQHFGAGISEFACTSRPVSKADDSEFSKLLGIPFIASRF